MLTHVPRKYTEEHVRWSGLSNSVGIALNSMMLLSDVSRFRVTVTILNGEKHALPVGPDCAYARSYGIAQRGEDACRPDVTQARPSNQPELWNCVQGCNCNFTDNRLQMAVFRDPRPLAVSAYFHMLREHPQAVARTSVDAYVENMLPVFCQWVSVRYLLFAELLRDTSVTLWYDEALENPVSWHNEFFGFVGLSFPNNVVQIAANASMSGGSIMGFPAKGIDKHEGGAAAALTRSFKDEISPSTLSIMDDILRIWLPPQVLEKIDLSPL